MICDCQDDLSVCVFVHVHVCVCVCVCVCVRERQREGGRKISLGDDSNRQKAAQGLTSYLCVCVCVCVCERERSEVATHTPPQGS